MYISYAYTYTYMYSQRRAKCDWQLCATYRICTCMYPPKHSEIALWPSTNGSIDDLLVLAGSPSTITDITRCKLISLQ